MIEVQTDNDTCGEDRRSQRDVVLVKRLSKLAGLLGLDGGMDCWFVFSSTRRHRHGDVPEPGAFFPIPDERGKVLRRTR